MLLYNYQDGRVRTDRRGARAERGVALAIGPTRDQPRSLIGP